MRIKMILHRSLTTTLAMALTATLPAGANAAPAAANRQIVRKGLPPVGTQKPTNQIVLSTGEGQLITLSDAVADVWLSNPGAADVYVSNPRQIHLFGKDTGESTLFATSANGTVIYSANIRVSQNLSSIDKMLRLAMPDTDIKVTTVGQIAVLTGTVATPDDSAQAQRLVTSLLNPGVDISAPGAMLKISVFNRLRTATPLQVNLQVKFAEVQRSFIKNIGANLITRDTTGGFRFNMASGRSPGTITSYDTSAFPKLDASARYGLPAGSISLPFNPATGDFVIPNTGSAYNFTSLQGTARTALGLAGKIAGVDVMSAIDLGETIGQVSTLANPNLTALSGETGTFLAGGEIPIPLAGGLGTIGVEYKQYGISLAYTPTVLADGRISLRVRPEVSQLDYANAITIGGTSVPGLTTRRAETTVELGSGQSFMIAGLLQNNHDNTFEKTPGIGDVPVLGALFRSNAFKRNETELVIVITPYLVKPVNANDIALPTDGYEAPTDASRILFGQLGGGKNGGERPKPSMAAPETAVPAFGAAAPTSPAPKADERSSDKAIVPQRAPSKSKKDPAAAPGFSIN